MENLWVTGYRNYELNVYDDKDPKLRIIKYALRQQLTTYLDQGLAWIITGAQLGSEQWTIQVAQQLKQDYPELRVAAMLPFMEFGHNWNEANQTQLNNILTTADFTGNVSAKAYHSPQQLKNYQTFMLEHTDGALMLYDPEYPGKPKYDYDAILKYQTQSDYTLDLIDMYDLEDLSRQISQDS
ncbi:DUF1273 domain-containing protein [Agrilactobacillus fermenti]|uniref:DUF1273 domain-containing protein n=1 Tax=Agrilactobacillus fermenti TaxID=2586909 RepID=UPI003A5B9531